MAGMDTDTINPLTLSLDEVIRLNRYRNQGAQQQQTSTSTSEEVEVHSNGFVNGHIDEVITTTIQEDLRDNSPKGNRSIFDRLGWKKPNQISYGRKTAAHHQALRAIKNAQQFKNRTNYRPVKNYSHGMPPPLTANVLRKHNQTLGNFTVRRRNTSGSVYSMSTQSVKPNFFRHSMKKCLDPEIQQLIRNMLTDGKPAMVQSSQGKTVVDHSLLAHYRIKSDCTALPTHVRFAMND